MPDPRDKLKQHRPPSSVADQIAKPLTHADPAAIPQSWEGGPDTAAIGDPLQRIDARTQRMARESASVPSSISAVRTELKGDISEVKADVKTLSGHVGNLRETVGEISGKLDVLPNLVELAKMRRQEDHVTFTAQVDVEKHAANAQIDVSTTQKKATIERGTKIYAIISTALAIGLAVLEVVRC